jgi:hypothetical protein
LRKKNKSEKLKIKKSGGPGSPFFCDSIKLLIQSVTAHPGGEARTQNKLKYAFVAQVRPIINYTWGHRRPIGAVAPVQALKK